MQSIGLARSLQRPRAILGRALLAATLLISGLGAAVSASAQELDISVASVDGLSGLTAVVAHSEDGVNLRAEPGLGADIIDTLPDGTVVELRVDMVDTVIDDDARWWPVRHAGQDGWIAGYYLESTDAAPTARTSAAADEGDTPIRSGSGFAQGDYVAVDTDDDTGLSMRAGPSTNDEILAGLGEGDVVQIMDGPFSDDDGDHWYLVTDGDFSAYVFAAYLVPAGDLDIDAPAVERESAYFSPGDFVTAAPGTDGVNVRSRASVNSRRLGSVGEGTSVAIVAGPEWDKQGDVWYTVQFGGETGYMFGSLLVAGASDAVYAASGATGRFIYPVEGYVFTQAYGCSNLWLEPYDGNLGCPFHNGIDLAAPAYTPILASDGGTVIASGWCDCGLGFYVEIDHNNGFATVYGHMAEQPYVVVGQEVNQGEVIGPMGSTGISTGPHVHLDRKSVV